jgi:hypothetical protein
MSEEVKNRSNYSEGMAPGRPRLGPLSPKPAFLMDEYAELLRTKASDVAVFTTLTDLRIEYRRLLGDATDKKSKERAVDSLQAIPDGLFAQLVSQLRWLSYRLSLTFSRQSCRSHGPRRGLQFDEIISQAHFAIIVSVRRLTKNRKANVEQYVRCAVWGLLRAMYKAVLPDILPPYSTNSSRADDDKYQPIRRQHPSANPGNNQRRCDEFALDFPACGQMRDPRNGGRQTLPSRLVKEYIGHAIVDVNDLLAPLSPQDRDVAEHRTADESRRSIARKLNISTRQVNSSIARVQRHLVAQGVAPQSWLDDCRDVTPQTAAACKSPAPTVTLRHTAAPRDARMDAWAAQSV